jgi:protein-tyrosine-phosphatase
VSQQYPKPIADEIVRDADVVVAMGGGDAYPAYPGRRYENWQMDDPAGQRIGEVRRIRDGMGARVERLRLQLSVTVQ